MRERKLTGEHITELFILPELLPIRTIIDEYRRRSSMRMFGGPTFSSHAQLIKSTLKRYERRNETKH